MSDVSLNITIFGPLEWARWYLHRDWSSSWLETYIRGSV